MPDTGDLSPGIARAWEVLAVRSPEEVCNGTGASFDRKERRYRVGVLGQQFHVDALRRTVVPLQPPGLVLTENLAYFFLHSVIWYLGHAASFPEAGRWVRPEGLRGGANFFTGAHALPLAEIARRYTDGRGELLRMGTSLGGERAGYGDESVTLKPLPRVTAAMLLWYGDNEFDPRADLLLDSSVEVRLPLDVVWSVAMMTCRAFLPVG